MPKRFLTVFLIKSLSDLRLKAFHNLQIQLLMKQGQVEINPGPYVHSFQNCLLIHRNVVESLNKIIQVKLVVYFL